jgi:hypothetical protein
MSESMRRMQAMINELQLQVGSIRLEIAELKDDKEDILREIHEIWESDPEIQEPTS